MIKHDQFLFICLWFLCLFFPGSTCIISPSDHILQNKNLHLPSPSEPFHNQQTTIPICSHVWNIYPFQIYCMGVGPYKYTMFPWSHWENSFLCMFFFCEKKRHVGLHILELAVGEIPDLYRVILTEATRTHETTAELFLQSIFWRVKTQGLKIDRSGSSTIQLWKSNFGRKFPFFSAENWPSDFQFPWNTHISLYHTNGSKENPPSQPTWGGRANRHAVSSGKVELGFLDLLKFKMRKVK